MKNSINFKLDGVHNRMETEWFYVRKYWDGTGEGAARSHARKYGAAGMWRYNGSFVLFYRDYDGKMRQRSWKRGYPI